MEWVRGQYAQRGSNIGDADCLAGIVERMTLDEYVWDIYWD